MMEPRQPAITTIAAIPQVPHPAGKSGNAEAR